LANLVKNIAGGSSERKEIHNLVVVDHGDWLFPFKRGPNGEIRTKAARRVSLQEDLEEPKSLATRSTILGVTSVPFRTASRTNPTIISFFLRAARIAPEPNGEKSP